MDLLTLLLAVNLCATLYALHKIRKVHLTSYRLETMLAHVDDESGKLFSQIQAFHALIGLIAPRMPLPPLRGWAASPDFLLHVASYALAARPRVVVECSSGASTVVLARCCELNGIGHVWSMEHDPIYAAKTRKLIEEQGLRDWATVVDAPLSARAETGYSPWYATDGLLLEDGSIDLLVIDGPPQGSAQLARYPALPVLDTRLSPDCTIFLDDADRADERIIVSRWTEEFPRFSVERLNAEKGCAMLWQTAGDER